MSLTIVCPLNSSPNAERALPSAFDAARILHGSLELFSVVEDAHMVGRRDDYLHQIGAERRCSGSGGPDVQVVVDPHAPRALCDRSADPDTMTVMATSTQPFLHAGYLGSAGEQVARMASNPALFIGPHTTTRLGDVEQVVVACDGSPLSETVIPAAREWADYLDVGLWIVTCIPPGESYWAGVSTAPEANYVRRLAQEVGAQWEVLHGRSPARAIAEWGGNALIAMTTHGRSGLRRATVGSVTSGVVRWATSPVLVANVREPNEPVA